MNKFVVLVDIWNQHLVLQRIIALVEIVDVLESKYLKFARVKFCCVEKFICIVGSMENLEKMKKDKWFLKSSLLKYLNELAKELSLELPQNERIVDRLNYIKKRQTNCWNYWRIFKPCTKKLK